MQTGLLQNVPIVMNAPPPQPVAAQPTHNPPAEQTVPLRRPSGPTFRHKNTTGKDAGVRQLVRTLSSVSGNQLIGVPRATQRDLVANTQLPDATKAPRLRAASNTLRKFDGNDAVMTDVADAHQIGLGGVNNNGQYPSSKALQTLAPNVTDYNDARPLQLMSQLSEVSLGYLGSQGVKTEEVEYGWGQKNNLLNLYASTNSKKSAKSLQGALSDPAAMIKWGMTSDDAHIQQVATKLAYFTEQQAQRRQRQDADEEGLAMSERLRDKFLDGNVQVMPGNRHAEQNIAEAMHEDKMTKAEIGGTKIRCGACTAELGANVQLPSGKHVCGKLYPRQASEEKWNGFFDDVRGRSLAVDTRAPARPRSSSPPAVWRPNVKVKSNKPSAQQQHAQVISGKPLNAGIKKSAHAPSATKGNDLSKIGNLKAMSVEYQKAKELEKQKQLKKPT